MDLFDFTAALASKQPTPGGGGASALTGALGRIKGLQAKATYSAV